MFDQIVILNNTTATLTLNTGAVVVGRIEAASASFFNLHDATGQTENLRVVNDAVRISYADVAEIS